MVKIYRQAVFVDDYGLTINLETDIGYIIVMTHFPRLNKWIGMRLICAFEIKPGVKLDYFETPDLHVRNVQEFIHHVLMTVDEKVLYPEDEVTKCIIKKYRRENDGTKD